MSAVAQLFLYPPEQVRKFIKACDAQQIDRTTVCGILNQFIVSIYLTTIGYEDTPDNERIRLTVDMNMALTSIRWRYDERELSGLRAKPISDNDKQDIIDKGVTAFHALSQCYILRQYLETLMIQPYTYVQCTDIAKAQLVLQAQSIA